VLNERRKGADSITKGQTVARAKRRQPYDPANSDLAEYQQRVREAEEAKRRDRKSRDLLRNARVAAMETDDPISGDKIVVLRSTRDDPLADLHDRNMIDEAQYQAGRAFQRDFEAAETGARAIDFTREYVDGGAMPEPLSEARIRAGRQLKIVYDKLGINGSVIVHDVLVHNRTRKQVAESRGYSGKRWEEYFGMRFRECLDCLALVYGFAMTSGIRESKS
jgi:hypothetical protein